MRLSILVPSVHTRHCGIAQRVAEQLFDQYAALNEFDRSQVEILIVTDNKARTIGTKRNAMLQMAQGEYVAFVDDDDRLEPDYLQSLLDATLGSLPDVVTFNVMVTVDGASPKVCRYSKRYGSDHNTDSEYLRIPNHICCVRRDLALRAGFADRQCGEDSDYAERLIAYLDHEVVIDRVLYHYEFDSAGTETQERTARKPKPLVDLVILSKALTWGAKNMTQKAINSAINGARGYDLNVIVVEQVENVIYGGATTIHNPSKFSYNKFANEALSHGSAEWVMVANNDLVFHTSWLSELLAAGHPFVSPADPRNELQNSVQESEVGEVNGKHMSGWCFMMRRKLFKAIGGLDEDFEFWCADDCVIEQTRAHGILPMLVPSARVLHLGSMTGGDCYDLPPEMTWGQVYKFEQKYGVAKFVGDERYINWKRHNGK